jgi:hypothetical protein
MSHPYRIPPPKPIDVDGFTMLVAVDALAGSLRVGGDHGLWKYTAKQRENAANVLLRLFSETTFTIVHSDGVEKSPQEGPNGQEQPSET